MPGSAKGNDELTRSRTEPIIEATTSIKVRFGETDKTGLAYFPRYFDWFALGWEAFMEAHGVNVCTVEERGFSFAVKNCECAYHKPVKHGDLLEIKSFIKDLRRMSCTFGYQIHDMDSKELVAEGSTTHVCFNSDGELCRLIMVVPMEQVPPSKGHSVFGAKD